MSAELYGAGDLPPKTRVRYPVSLILLGIVWTSLTAAQVSGLAQRDSSTYEYDVKAVFLYHFTRYLQWPEDIKPEVFTIVVLGESEIIAPLQEIAKKKTVGAIPIEVRQCFELEEIGRPRILFISKSVVPKLSQVLEKTRGTDILTVGEAEGLGLRGVAVNFVLREGTIKFEMNEKAIKEARIQISSQLLKLAILLDEEKGTGKC
jgi:hypothetical protein